MAAEKRVRADSGVSTTASEPEVNVATQSKRGRVEDDYDVCKAISAYSEQDMEDVSERRLDMLREEIATKQKQAQHLGSRAANAWNESPRIRAHYESVRQELLAEVKILRLELKGHEFGITTLVDRSANVNELEGKLQEAITAHDPREACKIAWKAASWLSAPIDATMTIAEEAGHTDLQRRILQILLASLQFLDLSDAGTQKRLSGACRHLMSRCTRFEEKGCRLSSATNARDWKRVRSLASMVEATGSNYEVPTTLVVCA